MRRIAPWALALALVGPAGAAGPPGAAAVLLTMRDNAIVSLNVSVESAGATTDVDRDLREIERWTGWVLGQPAIKRDGQTVSGEATITAGGLVQGALSDTVWQLVAALAGHGELGISIIGAPVATAPLTIENRFVRLQQSGGQGVQWYRVQVKDAGFRGLDELRTPETGAAPAAPRTRNFAAAWLMLIVAAAAVGVAAYLITRGTRASRGKGPRGRGR